MDVVLNDFIIELAMANKSQTFRKIPKELQKYYINEAHKIGENEAMAIKLNNYNIQGLIDSYGIKVRYLEEERVGNLVFRGKFSSSPPIITIYKNSIKHLMELRALEKYGMNLNENELISVYLCHEFFHYLEAYEIPLVAERLAYTYIGSFRIKKRIMILSEIAANAFAKKVLNLRMTPMIFDYLQ